MPTMNPAETADAFRARTALGATLCYPQDAYPLRVAAISPSGKTIYCRRLKTVNGTTGHEPAYSNGPFPVWDHQYTEAEIIQFDEYRYQNPDLVARWSESRKGYYLSHSGTRVSVGNAVYHRDHSL